MHLAASIFLLLVAEPNDKGVQERQACAAGEGGIKVQVLLYRKSVRWTYTAPSPHPTPILLTLSPAISRCDTLYRRFTNPGIWNPCGFLSSPLLTERAMWGYDWSAPSMWRRLPIKVPPICTFTTDWLTSRVPYQGQAHHYCWDNSYSCEGLEKNKNRILCSP